MCCPSLSTSRLRGPWPHSRSFFSQVVDYQACHPVSQHLATRYSDQRFSAVIDAYGVQEIYNHCGDYLLPGKPFVTVGVAHKHYTYSSMVHAVIMIAVNILSSFLPGDKKRRYVQVNSAVNGEDMESLRSMVEQGRLRVPVDSCWHMKDALEVRSSRTISLYGRLLR